MSVAKVTNTSTLQTSSQKHGSEEMAAAEGSLGFLGFPIDPPGLLHALWLLCRGPLRIAHCISSVITVAVLMTLKPKEINFARLMLISLKRCHFFVI